jgi:hypothetical protein
MTAHHHDEHDADVAWGGGGEHDSDQPVLLDEVPDVSSKFPAVPGGLNAAAAAAMGADPTSRKTLIGQAVPPGRRSSQPNLWAQGSSEDAIPQRGRYPSQAEFTPSAPVVAPGDDTQRSPLVDAGNYTGAVVMPKKGGNTKLALIVGGIAIVAVAAVAIVMMTKGGKEEPAAPVATKPQTGKVKFVIEPPDATVKIAGIEPHTGSPWSVDLDPGQIQVQINHDGFKSYVTTVDLSAGETQTLRVVLDKGGVEALSLLTIESTPPGLVVTLDGTDLAQRTPIEKMQVQKGPHVATIKENGQEVWRQEFMATGDADFEFKPILTEEKKRERAEQAAQRVAQNTPVRQRDTTPDRPTPSPTRVVKEDTDTGGAKGSVKDINVGSAAETGAVIPAPPETKLPPPPAPDTKPDTGSGSASATPPPAPEHKDATGNAAGSNAGSAAKVATAPVTTAPKAAQPAVVPPNAVHRTSGSLPTINQVPRAGETPPSKISTMLCIDTGGSVTTVKVLSKGLPAGVAEELQSTMSGWKYQPYKQGPNTVPACFVVSFAVKWPDSSSRGN